MKDRTKDGLEQKSPQYTLEDAVKKLGLPPDATLQDVKAVLESREKARQEKRIKYLRETRARVLENVGLPADTATQDVPRLLEVQNLIKKLSAIHEKQDRDHKAPKK